MLNNYIKIAFRSLISNRLFTLVNVLGLTIGMSAALLIFVWVQNELSFDRYHANAKNIYRIISHWDVGNDIWNMGSIPMILKDKALEKIPVIENFTLLRSGNMEPIIEIRKGKQFKEEQFFYVEEDWFEQFDYEIIEGSFDALFAQKNGIALTENRGKKFFGQQSPIGKSILVDSVEYQVQLVLADNPSNSSFQTEVIAPLASFLTTERMENERRWGNFNYMGFLTLSEGTDPVAVKEKINQIFEENKEDNNTSVSLEALADMRFNQSLKSDEFESQSKAAVLIFTFIGLILLLTAALNYINLSTALISKRVKEIGVKKIVGASFKHIFAQVMLETVLMSLIAFALSFAIIRFCLPVLGEYLSISLSINHLQIWMVFLAVILLNVLLAGIYPASLFAGFKPARLLKGIKTKKEGISLRKVLVVVQFSLTLVVLISTVVIGNQLEYIQQKDVGYDREQVVEISLDFFRALQGDNPSNWLLLENELRKIPELEAVANTTGSLIEIKSFNGGNFKWEGKPEDEKAQVFTLGTDENLADVFDLQMKEGRWFNKQFSTDANNYIINEAAAKAYDLSLGQQVKFRGTEGEIIGITQDFHFKSLHESIAPLLIHGTSWQNTILAKINSQNTGIALAKMQDKFSEIFPSLPFEYAFLDEQYQQLHENEAKMSILFQIFATLLIFISCLGLFGLATFNVEHRTREIGIRKVLGASVTHIVQLLSIDFLKLVFIALVIASPIVWYSMNLWLQDYAYRIDLQWWMFATAGLLAIGVALLTVSSQSIRAAFANPIESLRNE